MRLFKRTAFFLLFFTSYFLIKSTNAQPTVNINSLKFLDSYQIPFGLVFKNTTVGGLSGIDYDAANKIYYMVSDDKGSINPARYYTATISLIRKQIDSVHFTGVYNMLQKNGQPYPNKQTGLYHPPDPEAMRLNPKTKQLVWSSEGERIIKRNDTVLLNPAITTISKKGIYLNDFLLPDNLTIKAVEKGPRQNGVFEGITFADNYTTMFVSVEEPLYEDGPRAETTDNAAFVRILKFDLNGKRNTNQYAYKLEPVAYPSFPVGSFKINGITDILSIGKNKFLTVERSFSFGRMGSTIKIFIMDISNATDIKNTPSLKNNTSFVSAAKKLLLNMDSLGIYIANIEGLTFGPVLSNGHKTLLFLADNNFNPLEQSQLLLFEVVE
ncbi:MAG: esterase-like activity of phytase family protein [Ferruginibacter sp.]